MPISGDTQVVFQPPVEPGQAAKESCTMQAIIAAVVGGGAGMVLGARAGSQVHGFAVLKGARGLAEEVERSLTSHPPSGASWRLHHDYHFGGYARSTPALRSFTQAIAREGDFKPDVIYTGKMLYGLMDLIQRGIIAPSSRVVVWLTGNECTLPSSWNGRDDATSG